MMAGRCSLTLDPTCLGDEFIGAYARGEVVTNRHDAEVGGLVLRGDGLKLSLYLLRVAVDRGAVVLRDKSTLLGSVGVSQRLLYAGDAAAPA